MAWPVQRSRPPKFVYAILVVVLSASGLTAGCTSPDHATAMRVSGPEWQTVLRSGTGVASAKAPAQLIDVFADEHPGFDRLVFRFDGNRPGYRVEYGDNGGQRLTVILYATQDPAPGNLKPSLSAIHEVHRSPAADGGARTTVTVSAERLPFRVGLSVGVFYVDVAHTSAV